MAMIDYDERWAQGKILLWLNEVIRQGKFPFEAAEQEVKIKTPKGHRRYPDIVIWYKKPDRIACIIELKQPIIDVYNDDLVHAALEKASWAGIPFFATWNLNKFVLWETFKPGTSLLDRRLHHWDVLDIKRVSELERYERTVKEFLSNFLSALAKYYEEKIVKVRELIVPKIYEVQVIPKLYPDEILVYRLKAAVDSLYIPISEYILKKKEEDPELFNKVAEWFVKQGWIFSGSEEDYDRLARQVVYLFINKILFYNVLRSRFKLSPIDVSNVKTGEELREKLQEYFDTGIRLGYGVIFAANFLETIPIPDEAVDELKRLISELNKYDFSKIGYDVIGKVFEKLIPRTERHKLGQYFTRTDIVDLILGFTIKHPDAKVLDPACGSGTFLVRAYYRKKYLARKLYMEDKYPKPDKPHKELIKELWGIDVAKFPAHLAEINLIIRNLEALENKPVIACRDFFEIEPGRKTPLYELAYEVSGLTKEQIEAVFPKDFDAVVTNPPYTRQEEMEDVFMGGYKERLRQLVKRIHGIDVGKRSSIYVYFFFHGGAFVKEGGRVGLITSNSWLDVDYGKYLQEYFLKNFKIIAVIESKVERWFEDADIITAITILEKCSNKKERDENLVKFVQLKVPLRELIPEPNIGDEEEKERLRWEAIDKLIKLIEKTNEYYEDDKIRIFPKKQAELWDEGYDDEEGKYVGSKWGKYTRAPAIFFKILSKGAGLLVPLKEFAVVKRGFTTGADEFFYVTMEKIKKWGIEREFYTREENGKRVINYVLKSPREVKQIVVRPRDLRYMVLLIHKDKNELQGTNILKYISWGEERGYHRRPTCRARKRWYDLGIREPAPLIWVKGIWKRHITFLNEAKAYVHQQLYELHVKDSRYIIPLAAYLNSTLKMLFSELWGRVNFGQGVLWIATYEAATHPVIDLRKINEITLSKIMTLFNRISQRPIGSVFEEILGTDLSDNEIKETPIEEIVSRVSLDKVKPDRLELDNVFFDILGLTMEERLEVYKAVIELVASRIKRALSAKKRGKKDVIDTSRLAESIIERLKLHDYIRYIRNKILKCSKGRKAKVPLGKYVKLLTTINGYTLVVDDHKVSYGWDPFKAKFIYYASLLDIPEVYLPDNSALEKIVKDIDDSYRKLIEKIKEYVTNYIPDKKISDEVISQVLFKLFKKNIT